MTKNELNRFQAILTMKVLNWSASPATAMGSRLREASVRLATGEIQAASEYPPLFVTLTANSTDFQTPVRAFAASRKAALGRCEQCDQGINPRLLSGPGGSTSTYLAVVRSAL